MKRFSLILAILLIGSAAVFAVGQAESTDDPDAVRPFRQRPIDLEQDTITVTGTLNLTLSGHPELIADGTTWELMYPMYLADGIDVEDGEVITIEGIEGELGPGPRFNDSDDANVLHVVRAEIGGTEYDLSEYVLSGGPGMAMMGPRGSMPGRSPRGGYRFGDDDDDRGRFDDDDRSRFDSRRGGRR